MHPSSREFLDGGEDLPFYYGEDQLVLLPRDPYWLFAYWEISIPTRKRLESETQINWESFELSLRVHRFGMDNSGKESQFDIQINSFSDNWYIKAGVPDRKYQIEYGFISPEKGFQSLLTSNIVSTPRDSLSDVIDENWQLPDWQARRLYWRISRINLSSMEILAKER
jgi:uncharacterized protein